jgi:hypothetical protein
MFRLDYISCVSTVSAAILLGQKRWQGWLVAGINSILICDIAVNTSQLGFIPANLFCVALYAYNIFGWRKQIKMRRERGQLSPSIDSGAPPPECISHQYESASQMPNKQRMRRIVAKLGVGSRAAMVAKLPELGVICKHYQPLAHPR